MSYPSKLSERGSALNRARYGLAVLAVVGAMTVGLNMVGDAATPKAKLTAEQVARLLIAHGHNRFGTAGLQRALEFTAGENQSPGRSLGAENEPTATPRAANGAARIPQAGLRNVRVNNPALDTHQTDQTTQSETTIAVAGRNVAVGFNDSQQALFALTDGFDLTGYAYSSDGGRRFTDGGTLPNPLNFVNAGDPWLASDRSGRMYYGTLTYGGNVGNLEIAVARSSNGGRSWSTPTLASPNNDNVFYQGDKDAVTTGRDPKIASRDNVYTTWDDTTVDLSNGNGVNGLAVASSVDQGRTWSLHYADKLSADPTSCSYAQYIGAQPVVDPTNGTLYVAAEKIAVTDPDCTFSQPAQLSEVVFDSHDGGLTFDKGVTVAPVTAAEPTGALALVSPA